MDNEPYRDYSHAEAIEELRLRLLPLGGTVKTEHKLPDGKIADVLWLDPEDNIFIFEVKTFYKTSLAENALEKYRRWSDYLFMVVPGLTAQRWHLLRTEMCFAPATARVGVMGLDRDLWPVFHPCADGKLHGENRLKLLQTLQDPAGR